MPTADMPSVAVPTAAATAAMPQPATPTAAMPPHSSDVPSAVPPVDMPPAAIPAPELLGRLGAELADLAATVERLHVLAGAPAATDPAYVVAVQSLDAVEQTLRNLAGFLAALAPAMPAQPLDAGPALATITLADLAVRLAGNATPPTPATGDCELF